MHNGISFYLPISLYVTIENSDTILAPKRKTALLFLRRYFSAHDTAGGTYHVRGRKRAHGIRRGDKGVQKTLPGPKIAQKMVAEQQRRQHTAHRNTVINLRHKAGEEIVSQIRRGQHGQNQARKKVSEYGLQLRAKQKAKRYYGVLESQFAHYFEMAERKSGITGENLLRILESRLDNIVYRAGFAMSRKEARQLVLHRHFTVNGQTVNIPSYLVKEGDKVAVRTTDCDKIKECIEKNSARPVPAWLDKDAEKMTVNVTKLPERADIDFDIEEHLIVELYSK